MLFVAVSELVKTLHLYFATAFCSFFLLVVAAAAVAVVVVAVVVLLLLLLLLLVLLNLLLLFSLSCSLVWKWKLVSIFAWTFNSMKIYPFNVFFLQFRIAIITKLFELNFIHMVPKLYIQCTASIFYWQTEHCRSCSSISCCVGTMSALLQEIWQLKILCTSWLGSSSLPKPIPVWSFSIARRKVYTTCSWVIFIWHMLDDSAVVFSNMGDEC